MIEMRTLAEVIEARRIIDAVFWDYLEHDCEVSVRLLNVVIIGDNDVKPQTVGVVGSRATDEPFLEELWLLVAEQVRIC